MKYLRTNDDGKIIAEILTELDIIRKIKSYPVPPHDDNDIYNMRYPWNKFGAVSSGIYECWGWWFDDIILQDTTHEDRMKAYKEITEYYAKRHVNS